MMGKNKKKNYNDFWNACNVIYVVFSLIVVAINMIVSENVKLWCTSPRKIQFVWIISMGCVTVWKILGYYIIQKKENIIKTIEAILVSTCLFWSYCRLLSETGISTSMLLVLLIILGLMDMEVIRNDKKLKSLGFLLGYFLIGTFFLHNMGMSIISWNKNYSLFSHIYIFVACMWMFNFLIGKKITIQKKTTSKIVDMLNLDTDEE